MSAYAEQELAEFMAPLPQWLQKALWYSPMTDLESFSWFASINPFTADQLEELKLNPGWQPERYPQTAEELRPRFEQILRRCSREKWNAYRQNIKAERESLASRVPLPDSPVGAPRKDDIAEEGMRFIKAGKSWASAAKTINLRFGAGTVTKESLRSLVRNRRKSSDAAMVKTKT